MCAPTLAPSADRRAAGIGTRVVIGGAPITAEFAAQIGADGFAPDAGSAVDLARGLLVRGV